MYSVQLVLSTREYIWHVAGVDIECSVGIYRGKTRSFYIGIVEAACDIVGVRIARAFRVGSDSPNEKSSGNPFPLGDKRRTTGVLHPPAP